MSDAKIIKLISSSLYLQFIKYGQSSLHSLDALSSLAADWQSPLRSLATVVFLVLGILTVTYLTPPDYMCHGFEKLRVKTTPKTGTKSCRPCKHLPRNGTSTSCVLVCVLLKFKCLNLILWNVTKYLTRIGCESIICQARTAQSKHVHVCPHVCLFYSFVSTVPANVDHLTN